MQGGHGQQKCRLDTTIRQRMKNPRESAIASNKDSPTKEREKHTYRRVNQYWRPTIGVSHTKFAASWVIERPPNEENCQWFASPCSKAPTTWAVCE